MAEGGIETISDTSDNISLSIMTDERDALDKALNMEEDCNMLPNEMVEKMKRRQKQKEQQEKENRE